MKKILFLTNYENIIPQRITDKESIDINLIRTELQKQNIESDVKTYEDLNKESHIVNDFNFVFYASSQKPEYKYFILDHLINMQSQGVVLIPGIEHFIAHENKSFQTIFLQNKKIPYVNSRVISNYEEGMRYFNENNLPFVVKTSDGWGSRGVKLIKNRIKFKYFMLRNLKDRYHGSKGLGKIVVQEYLKDLEGDWKILIFGNKIAGLYRLNRKNDFRASGSGQIQFEDVPEYILNFAFEVKEELKVPWCSLDVFDTKEGPVLGEFQTLHFGLTTALKCNFHYELKNKMYNKIDGPINIDKEIANEIVKIIKYES
jgi:glutathione synthase/RimK-type ligase-like ATP-grasp enzyme